jgi:polysaccharide export outer membrane protein
MFRYYNSHLRAFSALCFISFQTTVFLTTGFQTVVAQPLPFPEQSSGFPSPAEVAPANFNNEISPQLNRYLLGPGDTISVVVQRPPGPYRLGPGDTISVVVQRFPDLSFQATINPEGNIIVPLIRTVSLQGLTLQQAQDKIRLLLNRYVVEPVVVLSLAGQRPDLSFQAVINPEGNILVPQVGTVSLQGLSVEEAQEKIRLALSRLLVDPIVVASLATPRPVQVTISGEVFRPGIYAIPSALPRVADALLTSGGTTMIADLRQVQVRRRLVDGSVISQTVDLYTALQNGTALPNLRLQDGDAIIVPRREIGNDDGYDRNLIARSTLAVPQIRVRVLNYAAGGIANQILPNGSTFIDALGGINLDTANIRDIALIRFDAERGQAVTQRLDGKKALSGDASQNVPLQDNDVIVVGRNLVGRITNALSTITQPFFNVQSFIRFFDFFTGGTK